MIEWIKGEAFTNCTDCKTWVICFFALRYPDSCWCRLTLHHVCFDVGVCSMWICSCMYTDPLQRVNSGVVLSSLQVFGKEAVGDRSEFFIAGISLAFIPGIANLRDAQPLLFWHLCQFPLWIRERIKMNKGVILINLKCQQCLNFSLITWECRLNVVT